MLILIAVVVAVAAAVGYLSAQHTDYHATSRVQLPPVAQAGANQAITVDPDTERVTSAAVLSAAATTLRSAGVPGTVTATLDTTRQVMTIQAKESSAALAQSVAKAVSTAYVSDQQNQFNASLAKLTSQRDTLQSQVATLQAKVALNSKDQLSQAQLNAIIGTYSTIAQQVTTATLSGSGVQLLQSAQLGTADPSQALKVLALAAVIGLLVGAGAALAREPFDTRIRSVDAAEEVSGAPVLSELPYVRVFRRESKPLPVADQPRSPFAAGIRELRTSVQVLLGDVGSPVLLVTSPGPVDGKTVIAANLAASYALSGKRTILVSGDLRRLGMDNFFSTLNGGEKLAELLEGGTADWLAGPATAQRGPDGELLAASAADPTSAKLADRLLGALRKTEIPQLWFLPAGAVRRDPADALAGPITGRLLAELKTLADMVVIDTPPVLAAADTAILAAVADGVLLVTRVGKTDATTLSDAVRRLAGTRAPLLGMVLNRSRAETATRYRDYYVEPQAASPQVVVAEPLQAAPVLATPNPDSAPAAVPVPLKAEAVNATPTAAKADVAAVAAKPEQPAPKTDQQPRPTAVPTLKPTGAPGASRPAPTNGVRLTQPAAEPGQVPVRPQPINASAVAGAAGQRPPGNRDRTPAGSPSATSQTASSKPTASAAPDPVRTVRPNRVGAPGELRNKWPARVGPPRPTNANTTSDSPEEPTDKSS